MELISLSILAVALLAVLFLILYWRQRSRRKKRLSPIEFCENCGKRIRRQERTWYWHGSHVCLSCRKRLGEMAEKSPPSP